MKTSNKLLIAFASALILLPILGIAIVSGLYYEKGPVPLVAIYDYEPLGMQSKTMTASMIPTAFNGINIKGSRKMQIVIKLIDDDRYGIKIPNEFKAFVTTKVDSKGHLQINVSEPDAKLGEYAQIWIYGRGIKSLEADNLRGLGLSAITDSLNLTVSNGEFAYLDKKTSIGKLNVNTRNLGSLGIEQGGKTSSMIVDLHNSRFSVQNISFNLLSIAASGASDIEIIGDEENNGQHNIKDLYLKTSGTSKVKVSNMQIDQCSGKFSDSTSVEMPARNINQMYNLKK
jgi:hypothetical protein